MCFIYQYIRHIKQVNNQSSRFQEIKIMNNNKYYNDSSQRIEPNLIQNHTSKNTISAKGYLKFHDAIFNARKQAASDEGIESETAHHLLNGGASAALENHVSRSFRSEFGIFFSGKEISTLVAECIKKDIVDGASIADPACGAGDLLIACLMHAPLQKDLKSTLEAWGQRVTGIDLHEELAIVAKERLTFLATVRAADHGLHITTPSKADTQNFSYIKSGNYIPQSDLTEKVDCVVMNPPFLEVDAPKDCTWSSGKVQLAAIFTEAVIKSGKEGQKIVAILPDVLRSGTRYEKWRNLVSRHMEIISVQIFGRFDKKTDVDVFILHANKREIPTDLVVGWGREAKILNELPDGWRLKERFDISVGSVVPHRHKNKGNWQLYIDVANAPKNSELIVSKKRRFNGRLHRGPFVVIRRTSSPSDAQRAIPTIILNCEDIAVENHLIVLIPKDKKIESCQKLAKLISTDSVQTWLNQEIRCRHLTTTVIKEIPIENDHD